MTVQLKPPKADRDTILYPESDGKPMAESDLHREIMVYIIHLLQRWFEASRSTSAATCCSTTRRAIRVSRWRPIASWCGAWSRGAV